MAISMFDNVRVVSTPITVGLGIAGLAGQVSGETMPSVTSVSVVGDAKMDYAIAVQLEGQPEVLWFVPELLEFVDHAPGTKIAFGNSSFVRSASGDWVEQDAAK